MLVALYVDTRDNKAVVSVCSLQERERWGKQTAFLTHRPPYPKPLHQETIHLCPRHWAGHSHSACITIPLDISTTSRHEASYMRHVDTMLSYRGFPVYLMIIAASLYSIGSLAWRKREVLSKSGGDGLRPTLWACRVNHEMKGYTQYTSDLGWLALVSALLPFFFFFFFFFSLPSFLSLYH